MSGSAKSCRHDCRCCISLQLFDRAHPWFSFHLSISFTLPLTFTGRIETCIGLKLRCMHFIWMKIHEVFCSGVPVVLNNFHTAFLVTNTVTISQCAASTALTDRTTTRGWTKLCSLIRLRMSKGCFNWIVEHYLRCIVGGTRLDAAIHWISYCRLTHNARPLNLETSRNAAVKLLLLLLSEPQDHEHSVCVCLCSPLGCCCAATYFSFDIIIITRTIKINNFLAPQPLGTRHNLFPLVGERDAALHGTTVRAWRMCVGGSWTVPKE